MTPKWRHLGRSGVFVDSFEPISHFFVVADLEQASAGWIAQLTHLINHILRRFHRENWQSKLFARVDRFPKFHLTSGKKHSEKKANLKNWNNRYQSWNLPLFLEDLEVLGHREVPLDQVSLFFHLFLSNSM